MQGDKTLTYQYNAAGVRIKKTYNGTASDYIWSGGKLVDLQIGPSTFLHFCYDAQNRPAMVVYNGTPYLYVKNVQGDIVALVDSAGNSVVQYKYDPWGRIESRSGSLRDTLGYYNPFRYRSYIYDEETWMYYLKDRYYYPELRRFICPDRVMGDPDQLLSHNLYVYCGNNPIIFEDKSGRLFGFNLVVTLTAGLIGAFIGGIAQAASNLVTHTPLHEGVAGAMVGGAVYNVVSLYSYGNTAMAAYASAAAESITNEIVSYTPLAGNEQKELNEGNIGNSLGQVAEDTVINGTAYLVAGKMAEKAIPVTAKVKGRKPTLKAQLKTLWAEQTTMQTVKQGTYVINYNIGKKMIRMTQ